MKTGLGSWPRFLLVAALLIGAGGFLRTRGKAEPLVARKDLDSFPKEIGQWEDVREIPIGPDAREVLGDGDFLQRTYSRQPNEPGVDFYLAYFPSQRTGNTMHSPQNCLPGAGWTPTQHSRIVVAGLGGPITINLYVIAKGLDLQVTLYWYQAHGRVVASEYWAKIYLVSDAIAMNRTDGALVRVMTPISAGEPLEDGKNRALDFAEHLLPVLEDYVPR